MGETAKPLDLILSAIKVKPSKIKSCYPGVGYYLRRYVRHLCRREAREDALMYSKGLLSDLPRKTGEPIARFHGVNRFRIQNFIGKYPWNERLLLDELRDQVAEDIGDPEGILVVDSSGFQKKGKDSVGVKRQWCGRLGKVENCQLGVFTAYVGTGSATLVDAELYLPREWARSRRRREKTHVPKSVRFRTTIRIADDQVKRLSPCLAHAWIVGDEEFGRAAWFRRRLARRNERYMLEVPGNTLIRPLDGPLPKGHRKHPFRRILAWAQQQPAAAWTRVRVGSGEMGPIEVDAVSMLVQAKLRKKPGPQERLVVTRSVESKPEWKCWLTNVVEPMPIDTLACVAAQRHRIEECFERAKGEAGLTHYEARSWGSWHHHMAMSLVSLWYLARKQRQMGEKNSRHDGAA